MASSFIATGESVVVFGVSVVFSCSFACFFVERFEEPVTLMSDFGVSVLPRVL